MQRVGKVTGKEFRKWRRSEEITQKEVADYCNINSCSISRWEHGIITLNKSIYNQILQFKETDISKRKCAESGKR